MTDPQHQSTPTGEGVAAYPPIVGDRPPSLFRVAAVDHGTLSSPLARLLLDAYTNVGDIVVDVGNDATFAAIAAQVERHHHALGGTQHLATMGHAAGYIDLILLHWPRPATNPRLLLLLACRALLRNAGVVVIVVSVEAHQRISHLSALTGAATVAGLRLIDHIAAIATDAATPVAASETVQHDDAPHLWAASSPTPHTDLLVFGPIATPR